MNGQPAVAIAIFQLPGSNAIETADRVYAKLAELQRNFPQVGRVTAIEVTGRNGIGEWGGRATEVRIRGTEGTATTDGLTFGSLAGLGTDWFDVVAIKPGT